MVGNFPWHTLLQFLVDAGVICFAIIYVIYHQLRGPRSNR